MKNPGKPTLSEVGKKFVGIKNGQRCIMMLYTFDIVNLFYRRCCHAGLEYSNCN